MCGGKVAELAEIKILANALCTVMGGLKRGVYKISYFPKNLSFLVELFVVNMGVFICLYPLPL
jgi:hypothetical protein